MFNLTKNERTFGIEIECTGLTSDQVTVALRNRARVRVVNEYRNYSHDVLDVWKVMRDQSIIGTSEEQVEIVSPVLMGEAGLAAVRKVVDALRNAGATVNESCGIHIHHDAEGLGLKGVKSLILRYAKSERWVSVAAGRFDHEFARRMTAAHNGSMDDLFASVKMTKTIEEAVGAFREHSAGCSYHSGGRCNCMGRRGAINFGCMACQGTVEFRQQEATLHSDAVLAWICLTQSLVLEAMGTVPGALNTKPYDLATFKAHLKLADFGGLCPEALAHYDLAWTREFRPAVGTPLTTNDAPADAPNVPLVDEPLAVAA